MAQVSVKINGFVYTVGCEDGQESHLLKMGEQVESRIDSIKALGGVSGEIQLLVLSSLLMADEIHDLRIELDNLRGARPNSSQDKRDDAELNRRIGRLAVRAEQIADDLDHA